MKVTDIIKATNGRLLSGDENVFITGFSQDTRQINQGDLYIPLVGETFDGHDFIEQAFSQGASGIITSKKINNPSKVVILVDDTLVALQAMARYVRETRNIKVVGVTGSVGKTSTKDMIESVLSTKYRVLKTLGNYNNQIGLPLTILRHTDEEVMILEMGMSQLEEIELLASIARPDIAIITNIGTAHIGELGGQENIFKAKMEITTFFNDNNTLILNGDDLFLKSVQSENFKVVPISIEEYDVVLEETHSKLNIDSNNCIVPVPGKHFVLNALVAIQTGLTLGISLENCITGVETFELTGGRNDCITLKDNILCIDSTYNASEDSMCATIDVVDRYERRKIIVLGDMLELGQYSEEIHRNVGRFIFKSSIDIIFCYGAESKLILEEATKNNQIVGYHFIDKELLFNQIKSILSKDDVIMFKGSNGMKLQDVVKRMKECYHG